MSPFERIYTYITDNNKCPQLTPRNTQIIHEWIAQGYDTELDIIPAIDAATKHGGKSIHSFSYFSGYIRSLNGKRIKEAHKPTEMPKEQLEAQRARVIAIKQRVGMYVPDADFAWLDEYQKGRVEA